MPMAALIHELIQSGELKTPGIINAFRRINRENFLPAGLRDQAASNSPLPIGHGQTISQPLTVAFMFELLQPQAGDTVLDIGSGSGWTTALLAAIVGPRGHVYAIERIAALKSFGERNVALYHFQNVDFFCDDGGRGLPDRAPFARILVSAAAFEVPEALKTQLTLGGRLVIPTVAQDIHLIEQLKKNQYTETEYPGFVFVPLVED